MAVVRCSCFVARVAETLETGQRRGTWVVGCQRGCSDGRLGVSQVRRGGVVINLLLECTSIETNL